MSLTLLLSCGGYHSVEAPLWDPNVEVAGDSLYVMLPQARALMRLADTGKTDFVDLDGATPDRLVPVPGGERLLVYSSWVTCQDPEVELQRDCLEDDLGIDYELGVLGAEGIEHRIDAPGHLDGLALSDDGRFAVMYLGGDLNASTVDRVADLDSVFLVDLTSGASTSITVGFAPRNILFLPGNENALVLSRSTAVLVDLVEGDVDVRYELTLDQDEGVDPSVAVLTPDGHYALVAISGEDLLYKIDLQDPSIDIEELDGEPTALAVDEGCDCTVVAYRYENQLDLLFHESFERETLEVEDRTEALVEHDGIVLAFDRDSAGHDVYAIDLASGELTEYVIANRLSTAWIDDSGRFGVGLMIPESTSAGSDAVEAYADARYGLAVLELSDDEVRNLVLEGVPTEVGLLAGDTTTHAMVLLDQDDEALLIDLSNPHPPAVIELVAPPARLGTLNDGRFWISHEAALGALTVIDPLAPGDQVVLEDFGAVGVFPDDTLVRRTP